MKEVRQAFHDQHSVVVNDEVGWGSAEFVTAAPVGVTEMAEEAAAAVKAYVAVVEDLDLTAFVEEIVLVGSSLEAEEVVVRDVLEGDAALAGVGLEGVVEPSELQLLQGSSFACWEPQLWRY